MPNDTASTDEDTDSVTYRARMYLTDANRYAPGRTADSKAAHDLITDMLEEIEALQRALRDR